MQTKIKHVFVLMLENRSFDHMLGFSPIVGTNAASGAATESVRLKGDEKNVYHDVSYPVKDNAENVMHFDPNHEFEDVVHQLCGERAVYPPKGKFPPIDNSGFVASYAAGAKDGFGDVMRCYNPGALPVLNALAKEFVLCDNWHAPMPGPTWPNRMFVHAASSGGLDHSPTIPEIVQWESIGGFRFLNGTIFDRLQAKGISRRLYGGDDFPMVAAIKGIGLDDIRKYDEFANDLKQLQYPYTYIFIEPSYDIFNKYRLGTSQHPLGDVRRGEALIKETYEAIRNSPHWGESMMIVTWDEHGGFFDHGIPPAAVAPGDSIPNVGHNCNGFTFEQYGSRVPALVISPLIPKNLIDHRLYDHASVPATLEHLFDLAPMTNRDAGANHLAGLITLDTPRDTPKTLPGTFEKVTCLVQTAVAELLGATPHAGASANEGNLPAIVHAAMQQQIALAPKATAAILGRVNAISTVADARAYLREVRNQALPVRAALQGR
jgi:phospholipase C